MAPSYTLDDCASGLQKAVDRSAREILKAALWLLKAHAIHARPEGRQRKLCHGGTVNSGGEEEVENTGFNDWLLAQTTFTKRTAYRWIGAARRLELTAESTEADVMKLDLSGFRLTLPAPEEDSPAGKGSPKSKSPGSPSDKAVQMWLPLFGDVGRMTAPDAPELESLRLLPLTSEDPEIPSLTALELRLATALNDVREAMREVTGKKRK